MNDRGWKKGKKGSKNGTFIGGNKKLLAKKDTRLAVRASGGRILLGKHEEEKEKKITEEKLAGGGLKMAL